MKKQKKKAVKDLQDIFDNTSLDLRFKDDILNYANKNGYFNLVLYCENNPDKYYELLSHIE